ncbi:MAG: ABC transporter permease [Pseudomonadota bacterium]
MYEISLAWQGIRKTPLLSSMIVGAIGLGIGVFMILLTAYHVLERDPLPQKSERVFRVMVDSWGPNDTYGGGFWGSDTPPHMMTYTDAMNLMASDIPTHQAAMFATTMYLAPTDPSHPVQRPFQVRVRATFRGFFPMFDTPFLYGNHWDQAADTGPEPVVVLSRETNEKIFGGANSIGETVALDGNLFRVVGVLDTWAPMPLFYNFLTLGVGVSPPEDVFIPFHFLEQYQLQNYGADMNWKSAEPGFDNWLQSESVWLQYWAQLDTAAQKQRYLDFLDQYALSQRELGRFERPLNNRVYNVREWITAFTVPLRGPSLAFLVLGFLYLTVCLVNLVSMLLGKFMGRMQEIALRRALGATRQAVFRQHIAEVALLGIGGGLLGLGLSQLVLQTIAHRFELADNLFTLDGYLLFSALMLALLSGTAAGLVPAWRACSTPPVTYLKSL